MAAAIGKTCPLCLTVNDPADMLPVTMPHSIPPQSAPLFLCRLCTLEIMKAAFSSELIDPSEVLAGVTANLDRAPDSDGVLPAASPDPALVPESEPGAGAPTVDRRDAKTDERPGGESEYGPEGELSAPAAESSPQGKVDKRRRRDSI
jgi:hypothetical protein